MTVPEPGSRPSTAAAVVDFQRALAGKSTLGPERAQASLNATTGRIRVGTTSTHLLSSEVQLAEVEPPAELGFGAEVEGDEQLALRPRRQHNAAIAGVAQVATCVHAAREPLAVAAGRQQGVFETPDGVSLVGLDLVAQRQRTASAVAADVEDQAVADVKASDDGAAFFVARSAQVAVAAVIGARRVARGGHEGRVGDRGGLGGGRRQRAQPSDRRSRHRQQRMEPAAHG